MARNSTTDPPAAPETTTPHNDIPLSLKATLVDDRGLAYREFRAQLIPRWWLIWAQMASAYVAIGAILAGLVGFTEVTPVGVGLGILGAIGIGYALQFLANFFHEAAHHNLAPDRDRNDRLANISLGWLFGRSVGSYRRVHFQHHRALGTTMDSENSYFDALRISYLAAGLFGLKALRAMRRWREVERAQLERGRAPEQSGAARLAWMGVAIAIDAGLAAVLWVVLGSPVAAIAWLAGVLLVFPFLGSLRQLLEHRSESADPAIDYGEVDHGAVNRLFGDGPLSSTFGSAGFNRHALHHWEPNLSYTRLPDLERYLMRTELAGAIGQRQTSYQDTFLRLLEL